MQQYLLNDRADLLGFTLVSSHKSEIIKTPLNSYEVTRKIAHPQHTQLLWSDILACQ